MKTIYQLCKEKNITTKQLLQKINKFQRVVTPLEWSLHLKGNQFPFKLANRIAEIFDIDICETDIDTIGGTQKQILKPIDKIFKKADLSKIKNLPKASGNLCTGRFGQCKSNHSVQGAHYTGEFQSLFGKGTGQKVRDIFIAYLCLECHNRLDQPKERKSPEASHEFAIAICLSREIDYDSGFLIYKK